MLNISGGEGRMFFFKNNAEKETGKLDPDLFWFFKKASYVVKANGLQLSFNIFRWAPTWHTIKAKYIKV